MICHIFHITPISITAKLQPVIQSEMFILELSKAKNDKNNRAEVTGSTCICIYIFPPAQVYINTLQFTLIRTTACLLCVYCCVVVAFLLLANVSSFPKGYTVQQTKFSKLQMRDRYHCILISVIIADADGWCICIYIYISNNPIYPTQTMPWLSVSWWRREPWQS